MRKKLSEMTLEELWKLFPISLVEHKDNWINDYREMEERLCFALSGYQIIRISHIGSTAIDAIWAKDIVDILVEAAASESLDNVAKVIGKMGFTEMSSSDSRHSFCWGYTEEGFADKVYHLHFRYEGDNDELYFRDYMKEYPSIAQEYEALKLKLWKQFEFDRDGYTDAKSEFIKKYTEAAKKKYGNRYSDVQI